MDDRDRNYVNRELAEKQHIQARDAEMRLRDGGVAAGMVGNMAGHPGKAWSPASEASGMLRGGGTGALPSTLRERIQHRLRGVHMEMEEIHRDLQVLDENTNCEAILNLQQKYILY